jgi:polyisoprenoid-binding protein YceI
MNKTLRIALPTLLWAAQLQAQAAPAAPKAAPAAPAAAPHAAAPAATSAAPTSTATAAKPTTATPAAATGSDKSVEWSVDPAHSHIGFSTKHLGFSKVSGQFKKFAATIKADPKTAKISALEATAETGSIDTGIEKRDTHLKSDDFFAAEKFPQLKLVLKKINWTGNKFTATADLTIRDVTKPVTFKGELLGTHLVNFGQGPQQRAGYEAMTTINRKDFGLKWSALTEGVAVVADNVDLDLAIEMNYVAPGATAAATPAPAPTPAATASTSAAAKPTAPVAHADKPATPPSAAASTGAKAPAK